jgi:hypothetical protein
MGKEEFQFAHGFTQQSLHAAHKERPESPKLKRWRHDCSVVERALAYQLQFSYHKETRPEELFMAHLSGVMLSRIFSMWMWARALETQ